MSIEENMERLATAFERIAQALENLQVAAPEKEASQGKEPAKVDEEKPAKPTKRGRGRPAKPKKEVEEKEPDPEPEQKNLLDEEEETAPQLSYLDDVKPRLMAYMNKTDAASLISLLGEFGVDNGAKLAPGQLADVIERVEELLEESD